MSRQRLVVALMAAVVPVLALLTVAGGADSARKPVAKAAAFERSGPSGKRGYVRVSGRSARSTRRTAVSGRVSGRQAAAGASARAVRVRLFRGLVTASGVSASARARDGRTRLGGRVSDLRIRGRRRGSPHSARSYPIHRRGRVYVLSRSGDGIVGLRVVLKRPYRSYPAGTTASVAFARATARDGTAPRRRARKGGRSKAGKPRRAPRARTLRTSRGFAFPVYGKVTYSNDWGAPRALTGRHQGTDIFAPAGAPVLAVTGGTLSKVGTRDIPGNRLWLTTKGGDSFFYAHLSAFARDARNGARVKPGQVLGYVGSTGDAEKTPPHLHFEVHPGGGSAINPYPFLRAWQERRDVPRAAWLARYGGDPGSRPGALVVLDDYLER